MSKESFIKRSAITGKKYDVFDDTIRILNPNQAAFYVSEGVPILDVWLSEDRQTERPILVYLLRKQIQRKCLTCGVNSGRDEVKKTELFFPFEPKPKARPRFFRGHAYTPKTTADYEKQIRDFYKENTDNFYDTAICIKLVFFMPIPKSISKKQRALIDSGTVKCTKHNGDLDNLIKAVLDSLNEVAFTDDCLITHLSAWKRYSDDPGIEMVIYEDVE